MSANGIKMPQLHSRQLPRGVPPIYASTHSFRLCQESDKEMGNGEKEYISTCFQDDSQKVLSVARSPASTSVVHSPTAF